MRFEELLLCRLFDSACRSDPYRLKSSKTSRNTIPLLTELEFCRTVVGLVPDPKDRDPGAALRVSVSAVVDGALGAGFDFHLLRCCAWPLETRSRSKFGCPG